MEKPVYTIEQGRRLANISQESMAAALDMTVRTYAKKEKGQSRFYVDEALAFCQAVNLSMDQIQWTN